MGVVKLDGPLDGGITDNVAVSEVLGDNSCAGLLLLGDLVRVPVSVSGGVLSIGRGRAARRLDGDVVGAELGVVQEEGSLGRCLLLECDARGLSLALCLDVEAGNLAAGRAVRYSDWDTLRGRITYQKLKKSRISLSSVLPAMFLTFTVVADIVKTVRG